MTLTTHYKVAAAAALLLPGTAGFAEPDSTRSRDSLPPLPVASSHASDKSNGLPNADGHKPGNGNGYGHEKDRGRGHETGNGHGHDDDHNQSPG